MLNQPRSNFNQLPESHILSIKDIDIGELHVRLSMTKM